MRDEVTKFEADFKKSLEENQLVGCFIVAEPSEGGSVLVMGGSSELVALVQEAISLHPSST